MMRRRILGRSSSRIIGLVTLTSAAGCGGRFDFDVPDDAATPGAAGASAESLPLTTEDVCVDAGEQNAQSNDAEAREDAD